MKQNKELLEIIKNKKFKTFWHCLDYLILAGYSPMDAMDISIKEFTEDKIFTSVAFIRLQPEIHKITNPLFGSNIQTGNLQLIVGLINESNTHLDGMYSIYRTMLHQNINNTNNFYLSEIEDTCEVIKISNLTQFIVKYLFEVSKKTFKFELFKSPIIDAPLEINVDEDRLRRALINTPSHRMAQDYIRFSDAPDALAIENYMRLRNNENR